MDGWIGLSGCGKWMWKVDVESGKWKVESGCGKWKVARFRISHRWKALPARKLHDSAFYRTGVIADRSSTLREYMEFRAFCYTVSLLWLWPWPDAVISSYIRSWPVSSSRRPKINFLRQCFRKSYYWRLPTVYQTPSASIRAVSCLTTRELPACCRCAEWLSVTGPVSDAWMTARRPTEATPRDTGKSAVLVADSRHWCGWAFCDVWHGAAWHHRATGAVTLCLLSSPWIDAEYRAVRHDCRRLERLHRRSGSPDDRLATRRRFRLYREKEDAYWTQRFEQCGRSPPLFWRSVSSRLGRNCDVNASTSHTADGFAAYFSKKIDIRYAPADLPAPEVVSIERRQQCHHFGNARPWRSDSSSWRLRSSHVLLIRYQPSWYANSSTWFY